MLSKCPVCEKAITVLDHRLISHAPSIWDRFSSQCSGSGYRVRDTAKLVKRMRRSLDRALNKYNR